MHLDHLRGEPDETAVDGDAHERESFDERALVAELGGDGSVV